MQKEKNGFSSLALSHLVGEHKVPEKLEGTVWFEVPEVFLELFSHAKNNIKDCEFVPTDARDILLKSCTKMFFKIHR